ncbi:MAG: inositol 2-dehydrogenase [Lachnospiraceae bacterium]|nr:inositol 2-dehydrogenase [Lachnospiraceae bacterium]
MKRLKFGIVGLGRLGRIHGENIAWHVPGSELIAACSIVPEELDYAKETLGVKDTYSSYVDMIKNPELDGVVIVSPSGFHLEQIQLALLAGKHVFCEKPIGLDVDEIKRTITTIEQHFDQVFFLGFMRRYDASYQYAKELVEAGEIGDLTVVRCYGIDPSSGMESFVKFAKRSNSGGIFADMSIHDIDLLRWFTKTEVKRVWALGKNAAYPELDEAGELETGAAMLEMQDKTIAFLVAGRNAVHGYHVEMELIGTKGTISLAHHPEKNLVTICNEHGVVRPTSQNFSERFKQAFIDEMRAFVACINKGKQPEVSANDGLQATIVAEACRKSWQTGELINL